jgi:hypothetical protein
VVPPAAASSGTAVIWQWLVAQGLIKDVIAAAVAVVVGHAVAWRPWRAHRRRLDKIVDALDTKTPGGLADVARTMRQPDGSPERK